jgi:putative FmdB family regulatory protein
LAAAEVAMPIYEYRCSACGKELEALQRLSEAPLKTCPACHADTLVKRVSAAGFQLKGSGWYVTDFKGSGKPAAKKEGADATPEKSGEKGDAKADATADTKSESKTEAKTESKNTTPSTSSGNGTPPAST